MLTENEKKDDRAQNSNEGAGALCSMPDEKPIPSDAVVFYRADGVSVIIGQDQKVDAYPY